MLRIRSLITYPTITATTVPARIDGYWSPAHDDYLMRWHSSRSLDAIADTLGYNISTVKRHAKALGIR